MPLSEADVRAALATLVDPNTGKDFVSARAVKSVQVTGAAPAVELELGFGLLATISPKGGLPKRHWYVVRSTVGPASEPVETFSAYMRSPAADEAIARAHGDEIKQARARLRPKSGARSGVKS